MENIVVGTHNGASVYLRDVAKVVDSVEERAQKTYSNGVQGAMIVVQKQSGANSVAISQKVIDMLPQLQKSLPSDVKLGIIVNTSDNILNTIDSLEETIMYAMLFVILVVFVFWGVGVPRSSSVSPYRCHWLPRSSIWVSSTAVH